MTAEATLRAEGLEIVLPGGDGVGPWSGTIAPGESVLVIGPSGAGKSTFLRALAGAIPQHVRGTVEGRLRIEAGGGTLVDPVADGVAPTAALVGSVGQDPATGVCLPCVADDVALPLESRAVDPPLIAPAVEAALRAVGASHLMWRDASTLSGGELQRVALAAALVATPGILLLDEPTAMLDGEGVAAVREALRAVPPHVTTILVEHRLDEWTGDDGPAALPARTIALDRSGRVRADGPTADVLATWGRELVAEGCWVPLGTELAATAPRGLAALAPEPRPAPRPGPVVLRARGLAVGHGSRDVLRGVDLGVRAGEVLALIGRNGAGKSTLLTSLAGLEAPRAGTIEGPRAGLVFQNPEHQFVARTVREEVALGDPAGADAVLERLGLVDLAARSPFALSGGQKRRLSIAAMLACRRAALLLDEPTFGLDRSATAEVLAMLREAADAGIAVALTCHDLRAIGRCADRVAVLDGGRIIAEGTPEELVGDPGLLARAGMRAPRLLTRIVSEGLALRATLAALDPGQRVPA